MSKELIIQSNEYLTRIPSLTCSLHLILRVFILLQMNQEEPKTIQDYKVNSTRIN